MTKKFTIRGTQFRVAKKDILIDIYDEEKKEIQKDVVVGWVSLRGEDDPIYQRRVAPAMVEYHEEIDIARQEIAEIREEAEKAKIEKPDIKIPQEKLRKAMEVFMYEAVVAAIEDWDVDFFESEFNHENAVALFSDPSNNNIYNQLAAYMKERTDFLPLAKEKQ